MLTDQAIGQTLNKLERFVQTLEDRLFITVGEAEIIGIYETTEPLDIIPEKSVYHPYGKRYGGIGVYAWFRGYFTVPEELDGKELFLYPRMGYYEATLWVNGQIHSNYAAKFLNGSHGNHWCNRITAAAEAGEEFDLALECYCWHHTPGSQPFTRDIRTDWTYPVGPVEICVRDEKIRDFLFDLKTVLSLVKAVPERSFRRAELENALYEVHLRILYDPDCCSEEAFYAALSDAAPVLKEQLSRHNGDSAAFVALTGHSHMDTAWQWPITETVKKCARTYANQLNLMEEYPEYRFVQSSAYHADMLRRHAPELFSRIQEAVRKGIWEPNGGVWVECDCNLTGGEYMIRQFVWGQRFTRKYFDYTSDCFWLPDTFGYAYAIPQIMKGCGVDYFLTTKIAWNDTNLFPATTFYWQGLDGTRVLTHFNRTHIGPTPETLKEITSGSDCIRERRIGGLRLLSFGRGDGGGGPEFEMLESARRLENLEGVPKSGYLSVSDFMKKLEKESVSPTVYAGELYLELHRGTLTNQHEIKRNNRLAEIALHNLEAALVMKAVREGKAAKEEPVIPLMNTLLVHQFHDILPGTCIASVHEETRQSVGKVIQEAGNMTVNALKIFGNQEETETVSLYNPLGFTRRDTVYLSGSYREIPGCRTQRFRNLFGELQTAVSGMELSPYSVTPITKERMAENCPLDMICGQTVSSEWFTVDENRIRTPFFDICLDERGAIGSMIDRRNGRELVEGLPFNTFLITEDVPAAWDNWDIDADEEEKFRPAGCLISRDVISVGQVELRIRQEIRLTRKTVIFQDMVFYAEMPMVSFETMMDFQDDHRFIKTAFDTSLICDGVRNEIQFGCIRRSNHRSTAVEKARFEICNHKYSDLSEEGYGIALLNDCKYGLSVCEGSMRLSLHKGGLRPDENGDHGKHFMRYALLVHDASFGAASVVQPAYAYNFRPMEIPGSIHFSSLVSVNQPQIIIETVKPCEDTQKAYMVRLYESVGSRCRVRLRFTHPVKALEECNMLEERQREWKQEEEIVFTPFAIKTIKVYY